MRGTRPGSTRCVEVRNANESTRRIATGATTATANSVLLSPLHSSLESVPYHQASKLWSPDHQSPNSPKRTEKGCYPDKEPHCRSDDLKRSSSTSSKQAAHLLNGRDRSPHTHANSQGMQSIGTSSHWHGKSSTSHHMQDGENLFQRGSALEAGTWAPWWMA